MDAIQSEESTNRISYSRSNWAEISLQTGIDALKNDPQIVTDKYRSGGTKPESASLLPPPAVLLAPSYKSQNEFSSVEKWKALNASPLFRRSTEGNLSPQLFVLSTTGRKRCIHLSIPRLARSTSQPNLVLQETKSTSSDSKMTDQPGEERRPSVSVGIQAYGSDSELTTGSHVTDRRHSTRDSWDFTAHSAVYYDKPRLRRMSQMLWMYTHTLVADSKKDRSRVELLKQYRLHIFVCFMFVVTTLSVSLSWHFRNMAQEQLYSSQAIFFNPRTRELTLADPTGKDSVRGRLGLGIPMWMLPLHCPIVSNDNPHNKECLWKGNAALRIAYFQGPDVQCYNVSWESLSSKYAPHDCFYINTDKWYGPSNQSDNSFPISGEFLFQPKNYTLSNNGLFNSIVDFYWLSSRGAAIYINANNPVQVTWNASGDNQLCVLSNFSGPLYHKTNSYDYPDTNYTLCNGADSLKTHLFMQSIFAPKSAPQYPPDDMLQGSHWSLKSFAQTDNITQNHVLDLLLNITEYGFHDNHLTLDGNWQEAHGDLVFNQQRFPNVSEMMTSLHYNSSRLTISISPYFQYTSQNFRTGIANSMFVKDAGGEVTGLANFQGGLAAILDVFADGAIQWYTDMLQKIVELYEITSFRLSYGQQAWLPYKPHFRDVDATPNMYRKMVTESLAALPKSSFIIEHTSDSRHVTSLIPVVTEIKLVNGRMCITGVIETAMTLGLLGYPFVMMDGIKWERKSSQQSHQIQDLPPRELYIRWLQLATLFPAYQFTIMPWEYDLEVVNTALNLTGQHNHKILPEIKDKELQEEVTSGAPILRPVWWLDPENSTVHDMEIKDEFLIGNNLLVAPVLCEEVTERDIYIPPGVWEDLQLGNFILGPNMLKSYIVAPQGVLMFRRRKVIGER